MKMKKILFVSFFFFALVLSKSLFAADTIIIAGEDNPPFCFAEKNSVAGIDMEVAAAVFDKIGVKYTLILLPWARCWENLKTGEVDVGVQVSKKPEREEFVYYAKDFVWESTFVFFTNKETKDKFAINSYEDAKKYNLKIGIIKGNSYHDSLWQAFPFQDPEKNVYNSSLDPVVNIEINLKKLENNRINLFPMDKYVGLYTIKQFGLKEITFYDFALFGKPYPNVFSKASKFKNEKYQNIQELLKAYDSELADFKKTQKFKDIFLKYQ